MPFYGHRNADEMTVLTTLRNIFAFRMYVFILFFFTILLPLDRKKIMRPHIGYNVQSM